MEQEQYFIVFINDFHLLFQYRIYVLIWNYYYITINQFHYYYSIFLLNFDLNLTLQNYSMTLKTMVIYSRIYFSFKIFMSMHYFPKKILICFFSFIFYIT